MLLPCVEEETRRESNEVASRSGERTGGAFIPIFFGARAERSDGGEVKAPIEKMTWYSVAVLWGKFHGVIDPS